jgi:hypothetical protein
MEASVMQQTIDIPTPARADTETVITALETAAIFRSKGDSREAMRWLRRAAESAGAAGDDERALSLSRVAADLHDELDAATPQKAAAYPPPPSARSAPPSSSSMRAAQPPASARSAAPALPSTPPTSTPLVSTSAPPTSTPLVSTSTPPTSTSAPPTSASTSTSLATGARQAARVAVAISTTKVGVFELRLLADGETPRLGSSEAMLIMLDPTSKLLAR